jgi:S-adenosylmethionine:tRNA ribosyltransferase-isomerase
MPKVGGEIELPGGARARVDERDESFVELTLDRDAAPLWREHGEVPLPPYIERAPDASDRERYQTVFARAPGAVAAPTAGLHFDEALFAALDARGVERAFLTLHVGAGTFAPVRAERVEEHELHAEWLSVSAELCAAVARCRARGGRVVAVGTTSVRALETAARSGELAPFEGESALFIYPGFRFRVVDVLVTNFHLPESSLLMLVAAFAGRDQTLAAYRHAVAERYRFFSYGDAMLATGRGGDDAV